MMKKSIKVASREYLTSKIETLHSQRDKIYSILEEYSGYLQKIEGAIEVTEDMLEDLESDVTLENKKNNEDSQLE